MNQIKSQHPKLRRYLEKIGKIYDIEDFANQDVDIETIVTYYTQSNPGYSFIHSIDGSVHMALSSNGEFNKDDYYAQAKFIEAEIKKSNAQDILELATGKGFNITYLAKQNPEVSFTGIDITPVHVNEANKKIAKRDLSNAVVEIGDFHRLAYSDHSFNIVFEVESVCHALDLKQVLQEVYRVLRPSGRFIVFDGLKKCDLSLLSRDEQIAALLVEKSMAVRGALTLEEFLSTAEEIGFTVVETADISEAIMPNLARFQFLARGFFKYSWLGKVIKTVMPDFLVQNAIAGLLMPIVISEEIQGYYRIILERN